MEKPTQIEIVPRNEVSIRLPGHECPSHIFRVESSWNGFTKLVNTNGQSGELIVYQVEKSSPNVYDFLPRWLGGNDLKPSTALATAVIITASPWILDALQTDKAQDKTFKK